MVNTTGLIGKLFLYRGVIMAVPKGKISTSRRGMRRAHKAEKAVTHITEANPTGELVRRHHISADGFYRGRKVTEARISA